jgi:predicted nucleic acid-binding protein
MSGRSFVDTNVAVYAADENPEERVKHEAAIRLLADDPDDLVISTQVLQEFYVVVSRKLPRPLDEDRAARAVRGLAKLAVVGVDAPLVFAAVNTSRTARLSLWDALIIEAARQAGCTRVYSEDMTHGRVIRGVRVENPFEDAGHQTGHPGTPADEEEPCPHT